MFFANELVIDDSNFQDPAIVGDGTVVVVDGHPRYLNRQPPPNPYGSNGIQTFEQASISAFSREEIYDRALAKQEQEKRVSDAIDWNPKDQNGFGYCFPAGTRIRMADGTQKPIEQIRALDQVLTAEGNVRRVLGTSVRPVNEELVCLKLWGHSHLRATDEHPILTQRGYVKIGEIKVGDMVAIPKFAPETEKFIQTNDFLYERNTAAQSRQVYRGYRKQAGAREFVRKIPGKSEVVIRTQPVPDIIHMTPGFGRIIGLFLAEGHCGYGKVCWSFNSNEELTLAAGLVQLLESELGLHAHVRVRKNVCQVQVHGAAWARLFEALLGHGSDAKRLPPQMTAGPLPFLKEVLLGWIDGDRQIGNAGVTVSHDMALNMFDIANACGLMPILSTHTKAKTGNDGILRKHSWKVGWGDSPIHKTFQDETHVWRQVRAVDREQFEGWVHNFTVEGDNSYVAEGIGVHNCWVFGVTGMAECRRVMQGLPYVDLSATSVGGPIKNYRNQGGWGGDAIKYGKDHGWGLADHWPNGTIGNSSYFNKPEVQADRPLHMAIDIIEGDSNNILQLWTLLVLDIPAYLGLDWWSHLVYACDVVVDPAYRGQANRGQKGIIGTRIRNSWGKWGSANKHGVYGFSVLTESKSKGDFGAVLQMTSFAN